MHGRMVENSSLAVNARRVKRGAQRREHSGFVGRPVTFRNAQIQRQRNFLVGDPLTRITDDAQVTRFKTHTNI